jgi:lysozyme
MNKVCANGPVTRGIDIYHGDMITDASKLPGQISYAFLKAFEYSVDPLFESRWAAFKARGIPRGAYDFFHPSKDPVAQADAFLKIVGPLDESDLPCALDWESTDGISSKLDRARGLAWLERVEQVTKKTPIIYASPYFLQDLWLDQKFARFPLWVANYGVKCPLVPNPFSMWTFWQTSESGAIDGIRGHVDLDVFNGSLDDLKVFIAKSKIS